jgi:hypothetical protein
VAKTFFKLLTYFKHRGEKSFRQWDGKFPQAKSDNEGNFNQKELRLLANTVGLELGKNFQRLSRGKLSKI